MERHRHQQAVTCFGEEKLFSLDEAVSKQGQGFSSAESSQLPRHGHRLRCSPEAGSQEAVAWDRSLCRQTS